MSAAARPRRVELAEMGAALGWGALAASSLVLGALLTFARDWSRPALGAVLAFGAGALVASVSFELAEEGIAIGGSAATGVGLGVGALTYYLLDGAIAQRFSTGRGPRGRVSGEGSGTALALGAFLDGIPEQLVLGIGIAAAGTVSPALLIAIFVSNLPEAMGSATEMRKAGASPGAILRLWLSVAAIAVVASMAGFALADNVSDEALGAIDGFAAGALLVMLIDAMIPDARKDLGRVAGLVTVLGFAVATGLSKLS